MNDVVERVARAISRLVCLVGIHDWTRESSFTCVWSDRDFVCRCCHRAALADASPDIGKEGIVKCEVPGCDNPTNLGICDDCDQWVTDMVAADQGVPPIVAEIDEAIAAWTDGAGAGKSLHDFLGWSFDEYTAWVADETAIPDRALATPPSSEPTP